MRLAPTYLLSLAAAALLSSNTAHAQALPKVYNDGTRYWRTYASQDSPQYLFNISTVAPAKTYTSATGKGMYAWNFVWRGKAYNPSRPLFIVLGSSVSRCNDISDVSCVISKTLTGGYGGRIYSKGGWAQAMLQDSNFGVLQVVSPVCYNTTRLSPIGNNCDSTNQMHALRHYRPDLIIDILNTVSGRFGFDKSKVIGTGVSMGGRGILRLATQYKMRSISVTAGNLEDSSAVYMQAQTKTDGNFGENCWSLNVPNLPAPANCSQPVQTTLDQAAKLSGIPVQLYASSNDRLANLTAIVRPSCESINSASTAAGKGNVCTLRIQTRPYGASSSSRVSPPDHNALCSYGQDPADLNWMIKSYNGKSVTVSTATNITGVTTTTTTTSSTTKTSPTTTTMGTTSSTTSSTSTSTSTITDSTTTASSTSTDSTSASTPTSTSTSSTDTPTSTPTSTSTSTDSTSTSTSTSTTTDSATSTSTTTDSASTPTSSSSSSTDTPSSSSSTTSTSSTELVSSSSSSSSSTEPASSSSSTTTTTTPPAPTPISDASSSTTLTPTSPAPTPAPESTTTSSTASSSTTSTTPELTTITTTTVSGTETLTVTLTLTLTPTASVNGTSTSTTSTSTSTGAAEETPQVPV